MSSDKDQPSRPKNGNGEAAVSELGETDKLASEDAAMATDEAIALELPIQPGDFEAQPL